MVIGLNKGVYVRILIFISLFLALCMCVSALNIALRYGDPRLNLSNQYWKEVDTLGDNYYGFIMSQNEQGVMSNAGKFRIATPGTYNVWTRVVPDAVGQCRSGGHTRRINLYQTHSIKMDTLAWIPAVPQTEPGDNALRWTKVYDSIQLTAGEHTVQLIDTGGKQEPCGVALIYPTYGHQLLLTTDLNLVPSWNYLQTSDSNKETCDAYYTCEDNQSCYSPSYFSPYTGATNVATTGNCCGDQPNERFTKIVSGGLTFYKCLVDEPDSAQNICEAVTGVYDWWNPDNNLGTIDDNCCGDDDYDQGVISKESAAGGIYLMCDRTATNAPVVRQSTNVYAGSVYQVRRSSTEDYDVLATDTGKFIPCESSTPILTRSYYKPAGTFANYPLCDPNFNAQDRCIRVGASEYLCNRKFHDRARIYECRNALPSGGIYSATGSAQEGNANDENKGYVLGKAIPNPFPDDWSGFSRVSETPCTAEFCTTFTTAQQDTLSTSTFKRIKWTFSDFVFDIYFERPEKSGDLDIYLAGDQNAGTATRPPLQDQLSKYFTGSRKEGNGRWYHVIIPAGSITLTSDLADAFSLIPKSANIGKVKLSNPHLESVMSAAGYSNYYCGEDPAYFTGMWVVELDNNSKACDAQLTADWTGTMCCGDDFIPHQSNLAGGFRGEFFFDTQGMCFNSMKVPETGSVQRIEVSDSSGNKKYKILADSSTGKIYSCGANETGFTWISSLVTTTIPHNYMVEPAVLCTAFGTTSRSYFCNGTEWSDATYTISDPDNFPGTIKPLDRTVAAEDPTGTNYGCCRQDECFDGTTCVDSEHDDQPETPTGGGLLCMRGHWVNTTVIYDWLNDEFGFCAQSSQCILEPGATTLVTTDETLSICKDSGWYAESSKIPLLRKSLGYNNNKINAIYCDNGKWTSRTKFVAQKMLGVPSTDDYTLVCGLPSEVLVDEGLGFRAYNPVASSAMDFTNEFDSDVFNHLCVLQYQGKILLGATFNRFGDDIEIPIENQISFEKAVYEAFDIKYIDLSSCSGSTGLYDFEPCTMQSDSASNPRFYWNNLTQSLIYTPNGGDMLRSSFVSNVYDIFITPILNMLGIVKRNIFEVAPTPLQDTTLFSRLYVRKIGNRKIFSIIEPKKGS
ncbi:hypothetical protein KY326_00095, partial [Candidatus Woesearchaeota archaeon]|nr:hypothetical protein [Candidatus Woesearchaeota archaeon]